MPRLRDALSHASLQIAAGSACPSASGAWRLEPFSPTATPIITEVGIHSA